MLDDFIHIRQRLEEVTISANEIVGTFTPNADEIARLKRLVNGNCLDGFVQVEQRNKSVDQISEGERVTVRLYSNRLVDEKFFETFDDLLKFSSQSYPTYQFYVHKLAFDSRSQIVPQEIQKFKETTKLIGFLKSISDYQKANELVFFQSKQLILITEYSITELQALPGIDNLINHIQDSADKEERKIIFTNELIAHLLKIPETKSRFGYLLKNFSDLAANYHKSHSLYLEKYSYQKFKSEIDKEIIEYSKKIQSVINDAQSKLVAIPAAFLLIVGQFDLTGDRLYFNLALVLSAFVFSVLLEVLLGNQFSALDFVKEDINRFKNSVDGKKVQILGDDFASTFTKIDKLHGKQKTYLNIIRCLVWLTPILAVCLFVLSLTNNTFICFLRSVFQK